MLHRYIYHVSSPSGKYYVGRHTTSDLNDGYLGSGKWVPKKKVICPNCGHIGGGPSMYRYHFNHCKKAAQACLPDK